MNAETLLRAARRRAGLSQAALARRAGTAQSAVSAYELGRKSPSIDTLRRLLAAAGGELELSVVPRPAPADLTGELAGRLRTRRGEVLEVLRRHGASRPRVYGSVARGEERPGSDIDLVVALGSSATMLTLASLSRELASLLDVEVDVVSDGALAADPAFADAVAAEAVPL